MIIQTGYNDQLKAFIADVLDSHALMATGTIGFGDLIAFQAIEDDKLVGVVVVQQVFCALQIKFLAVASDYRRHGIGHQLVQRALEYAYQAKCNVAFVETFNYQARDFYLKMGFHLEFTRESYGQGIEYHYLKHTLIT